jgi:hypothetical protein
VDAAHLAPSGCLPRGGNSQLDIGTSRIQAAGLGLTLASWNSIDTSSLAHLAFDAAGLGTSPMLRFHTQGHPISNDLADNLSARERVALFCVATGVHYSEFGMMGSAMKALRLRGLVTPKRGYGEVLTDSGRVVFRSLLRKAGFKLSSY